MMEVMLAKKKPLSELAAPFEVYPKALGDTGRILVRESGTEPVVRVMVEVPEEEICRKYVDEVVSVIEERGYRR